MFQARTLALMCAVLIVLSVATAPIYGQEASIATISTGANHHGAAAPALASSTAVPAQLLNLRVYTPLVMMSSTTVGPFFESTTSCGSTFDPPVTPPATIAYGIRQLTVFATVRNGTGLRYSIEWRIDNKLQPALGRSGRLVSNLQDISSTIIATPPTSNDNRCELEIPAATYDVTIKVNDQVVGVGAIVIR